MTFYLICLGAVGFAAFAAVSVFAAMLLGKWYEDQRGQWVESTMTIDEIDGVGDVTGGG